MPDFQKVSKLSEIAPGEMKMVTVKGNDFALCNVEGKIHCIDNNCSHQGAPLSEGILSGKIVTCPWHNWKYDVTTGDCTVNSMANVNCFPVKVEGDDILVAV